MAYKNLLIFMPSIEGGGVEKNFFIITNSVGGSCKLISANMSAQGVFYENRLEVFKFCGVC